MVTSFSQCVRLSVGRGPDVREGDESVSGKEKRSEGGISQTGLRRLGV